MCVKCSNLIAARRCAHVGLWCGSNSSQLLRSPKQRWSECDLAACDAVFTGSAEPPRRTEPRSPGEAAPSCDIRAEHRIRKGTFSRPSAQLEEKARSPSLSGRSVEMMETSRRGQKRRRMWEKKAADWLMCAFLLYVRMRDLSIFFNSTNASQGFENKKNWHQL